MHLALVPRRRLAALPDAAAVLAALDDALAARMEVGLASRAFDPEEGLAELGVAGVALEQGALVAQLRATAQALALRGTIVESLWIVGGPWAVPFGSLPNPMPDRDGPLRSDAVYGLADSAEPLAQWPAGRTPDGEHPAPALLATLLRQVAADHRAGPRSPGATLALSADRWAAVSSEVLAGVGSLALVPPLRDGAVREQFAASRLIYCNLHGVRGTDIWYGQAANDSELVPALRPETLAGLRLVGAAVISQACFGARLEPAEAPQSLALTLLLAGASALFCGHGLTYGALEPPPSESDLLARELLVALRRPNARLGTALLEAQTAMLRELLSQRAGLGADELKTLLGFGLYGDPALAWG